VEVLRRERRVSYRALRRRFDLDEEYLADLKVEIIQQATGYRRGRHILVWTGEATPTSVSAPERSPWSIPRCISARNFDDAYGFEGERKQVTVLFADIKAPPSSSPASTRKRLAPCWTLPCVS